MLHHLFMGVWVFLGWLKKNCLGSLQGGGTVTYYLSALRLLSGKQGILCLSLPISHSHMPHEPCVSLVSLPDMTWFIVCWRTQHNVPLISWGGGWCLQLDCICEAQVCWGKLSSRSHLQHGSIGSLFSKWAHHYNQLCGQRTINIWTSKDNSKRCTAAFTLSASCKTLKTMVFYKGMFVTLFIVNQLHYW